MPKPNRQRLESLNIHLLKLSLESPASAIQSNRGPSLASAPVGVLKGALLYFRNPPARHPSWAEFLEPAFSSSLTKLRNRHASAVLLFPAARRWFAVTFGYGASLLKDAALEPDFGFRTALNLCDTDSLRAIDYRTIEERTRIGRVQISDPGSVGAFQIDSDTDLLRGITARSSNNEVCERITAHWSNLCIEARVHIDSLPALARKLLTAYRKKHLPADFAWIEHVRRVSDPALIEQLEQLLNDRLQRRDLSNVRLCLPEIESGIQHVDAYLFKANGIPFDSDLSQYLNHRPRNVDGKHVHAAQKNHSVVLSDSATGNVVRSFSVFRCIVAECEHQGHLYLLADGEWFLLDRDFVEEVDHSIRGIPVKELSLPPWKAGEREDSWNIRASAAWKDAALLDKSNPLHGGGRSRIEPADLITKDGMLVHVKRRDKNSAGLSHLFAQATVAAETLSRDLAYRKKVAAVLPRSHSVVSNLLTKPKFDPSAWTIVLAILGADPNTPASALPFFSKVNLRKHAARLRDYQFKVAVSGISKE